MNNEDAYGPREPIHRWIRDIVDDVARAVESRDTLGPDHPTVTGYAMAFWILMAYPGGLRGIGN